MITFCTIQNVEKDCQTNIEPITVIMMKKIASGIFLKYSSNELLFIAKTTFLYLQILFFFAPASNLQFHFHASSNLKKFYLIIKAHIPKIKS